MNEKIPYIEYTGILKTSYIELLYFDFYTYIDKLSGIHISYIEIEKR
jgi:hypothetical protein